MRLPCSPPRIPLIQSNISRHRGVRKPIFGGGEVVADPKLATATSASTRGRGARSSVPREHRCEGSAIEGRLNVRDLASFDLVPLRDESRGRGGGSGLELEEDGRV